MGNLCGLPLENGKDLAIAEKALATQTSSAGPDKLHVVSQANGHQGAALPSPTKAQAPAKSSSAQGQDPIQTALASARVELERNQQQHRKFEDHYQTSKLIGHGAFAKVCICTHNETKEKYAVKTVQKNHDDPGKQREGKSRRESAQPVR